MKVRFPLSLSLSLSLYFSLYFFGNNKYLSLTLTLFSPSLLLLPTKRSVPRPLTVKEKMVTSKVRFPLSLYFFRSLSLFLWQ